MAYDFDKTITQFVDDIRKETLDEVVNVVIDEGEDFISKEVSAAINRVKESLITKIREMK